jgi:hypothetical protein
LLIGDWLMRRNERSLRMPTVVLTVIAIITTIYLLASAGRTISFIYFQF